MVNPLSHWLCVPFCTRFRIPLRGLSGSWGIRLRIPLRGLSGFWVPLGLVVPAARAHKFTRGIRWHIQFHERRWWQVNYGGHQAICGKSNQRGVQNEWDVNWVVPAQTGGTKPPWRLTFSPAKIFPRPSHTNKSPNSAWTVNTTPIPAPKINRAAYPETPQRKQEAQNNNGKSRKSNLKTHPIWKIPYVY